MSRLLIALILSSGIWAMSGVASEPEVQYRGESIDAAVLTEHCKRLASLGERHPEFKPVWSEVEECLSIQIVKACREKLIESLVRDHPPDEGEVQDRYENLKAKGLIPGFDESLARKNRLLMTMRAELGASPDRGEETIREIYERHRSESGDQFPIDFQEWRMHSLLISDDELLCDSCLPTDREGYDAIQKSTIRRYLARKRIAEMRIDQGSLLDNDQLRAEVENILAHSSVGKNLSEEERSVEDALRNALVEREWELYSIDEIRGGLEIPDTDLRDRVEAYLETLRRKKEDIARYEAVFFPPWE